MVGSVEHHTGTPTEEGTVLHGIYMGHYFSISGTNSTELVYFQVLVYNLCVFFLALGIWQNTTTKYQGINFRSTAGVSNPCQILCQVWRSFMNWIPSLSSSMGLNGCLPAVQYGASGWAFQKHRNRAMGSVVISRGFLEEGNFQPITKPLGWAESLPCPCALYIEHL